MDGESPAERESRLRSLWDKLNPKKAESLDLDALKDGLGKMNHPLKDADSLIKDMLGACDINHDGRISYDEFCRFCTRTEKELWQLFQAIDRDHSGNLDKAELSVAFERAGLTVPKARLDRFFNHIDKNHDGTIDFNEWRDFLLFIPANAPGLKAVFAYYQSTAKLNSEGDVHINDEAIQGLGTILGFFKSSLFGAITQLVKPSQSHAGGSNTMPIPAWEGASKPPFYGQTSEEEEDIKDDPFIPIRPARRKQVRDADGNLVEAEQGEKHIRLMDFVPDVGYFLAGGLAGITSRTATAPLDRLKVYLIAQTGDANNPLEAVKGSRPTTAVTEGARSLLNASKELWAAGGFRSLFAGNGLNILKVMPESSVKFGAYEASKRFIARMEGHNDPRAISDWSMFTAGGVAGMIAQAAVYPLDTLKFQMQCDTVAGGPTGNKLIWSVTKRLWASHGIVSFYRGLPMGLVGMFPYAAIDLSVFEKLKRKMIARNRALDPTIKHDEDALPGSFTLAFMGGFSGAIGASVVYPINLLRTRLQSQGTASHPRTYTGIVDVTRQTLQGEGIRGLFKGLTPNLLKVVPAVSITYVVYEKSKAAMHLQ